MFPYVAVPAVWVYPWMVTCPPGGIGSPSGAAPATVVPPAAQTVPVPVLIARLPDQRTQRAHRGLLDYSGFKETHTVLSWGD